MPKEKDLAGEMLADLAELSGIPLDELKGLPTFETYSVYDEPTDDLPLDLESPEMETDDYFDYLFDEIDVDAEEADAYGDD